MSKFAVAVADRRLRLPTMFGGLLLSTLALVASACASAPVRPTSGIAAGDTAYLQQRLDYEIAEEMDETGAASIAISVVNDAGPIFEKAYGFADVDAKREATIETPYRVGSNSKLLILFSILKLVDEGKIDLDAPLKTYLPTFSIGAPPEYLPGAKTWTLDDVTIRSMLTHESGLPNDYLERFFAEETVSLDEILAKTSTMRAAAPANFAWSYSNLALALLGLVVERVAETPLEDYVEANFFVPWKMSHATFRWDDGVTKTIARGYKGGEEKPLYKISMWPAGRMMASTHDMGLMASALLRGGDGAMGADALARSMEPQNAAVKLDEGFEQGLTWMLNRQDVEALGPTVEHGGDTLYHHSAYAFVPKEKIAVYVVTNEAKASSRVRRIASLALALALEAKRGAHVPEPKPITPSAPVEKVDHAKLKTLAGRWSTAMGAIDIEIDDDIAKFEAFDTAFNLREIDDGRYGLWVKLFGLFSLRPDGLGQIELWPKTVDGLEVLAVSQRGFRGIFGLRYVATAATAPWKARVGSYIPKASKIAQEQIISGLSLEVDDSGEMFCVLNAEGNPPLRMPLYMSNDQEAVTVGIGRGQSMWLRADGDALTFSGLELVRAPKEE